MTPEAGTLDEAEDEATVCVVCGKELSDDAAALAHLNEALELERLRRVTPRHVQVGGT